MLMGIKRRTRIWTTVGTAALLGGLAGCSEPASDTPADEVPQSQAEQHDTGAAADHAAEPAAPAGGWSEGEGEGEGGSGGGEFGIDPVAAESDPVVYMIALEVMRAHYLAGIDAYRAGDRTAGAEMFAHPINEIYIDFEPVLENLGAPLFGDTMTDASVAPYSGAGEDEIVARVDDVLVAIDDAAGFAPESDASEAEVHARVLTDLLERGALQYRVAASDAEAGEAYLDGYGFARAAERYAAGHIDVIAAANPALAGVFAGLVDQLNAAFPTALRPDTLEDDAGALVSAVAAAKETVNTLP
ncbi:hypothetical protein GCM10017621_05410 [Maricaulis virginensis]|uniref:Uncharacterized protein n=2 Tax=Maricaulis virginensis TaxID=144022 RepID=A0A9W6IIV7_9PROT|nr:hypothetical protein GCM10017621_05410 [Maricaulis virginensis]